MRAAKCSERPAQLSLRELPALWRSKAEGLRPFAEPVARAFEQAADDLQAVVDAEDAVLLTLEEAASLSGYSTDHLARQVRAGTIQNAGRKGAPRVRARDLPRKAAVARRSPAPYDPAADARELLSARREDR